MPHSRRPRMLAVYPLHARLAPLAPLTATGHVPDCWASLVVSAENHLRLSARAKLSHPVPHVATPPFLGTGGGRGLSLSPSTVISRWSTGRTYVRLLSRVPC